MRSPAGSTHQGPAERGVRPREGADLTGRIAQVTTAVLLAVVSVLLLVPIHRLEVRLAGIDIPVGLLIGFVFQLAACLFLVCATGRRLPLVVLAVAWGALVMPFAVRGVGGGILMPAAIAEVPQYSGWIVQAIGVGVPLLVLAVLWALRLREITRTAERRP